MKGLYIYCISKNNVQLGEERLSGVEFASPVFNFPYKDIEMIVSNINSNRWKEKDLKEKMGKDSGWAIKNISLHHDLITNLGKDNTIIPMRFGIILKDKRSALQIMKDLYPEFKKILHKFEGHSEWNVKIYAHYDRLRRKMKRLEKIDHGHFQYGEWRYDKADEEYIKEKMEKETGSKLEEIIKILGSFSPEMTISDPISDETGRRGKEIVFSSSVLLNNDDIHAFRRELMSRQSSLEELGMSIEVSGPWPPYSFAQMNKSQENDN